MNKFSPAPWHIAEVRNEDSELQTIILNKYECVVARLDVWKGKAIVEMDANAALLVVAPELLDALQNLYNACEFWEDRADPVLKAARAAIQKAESE